MYGCESLTSLIQKIAPYKSLSWGPVGFFHSTPLLGGSDDKESVCNVGDPGSVPGLGRSPGEGKWVPRSLDQER